MRSDIIKKGFDKAPNSDEPTKNKDKNITKVRFIDLPDNLKEKKHKDKTKYIAQKAFKSEKNKKKAKS